jgi:hypothetical protein
MFKKFIVILLISICLIITNICYWLCSDIQDRCVEKIALEKNISFYEKFSILTLHLGICSVGTLYCPEAASMNFKMLTTKEDTVYLYSNKWLTPKIKKRFENNQLGKMAWNGDIDYAWSSPEKNGAVLLNWCTLKEQKINNQQCYVAECDYTWKVPSKTTFKITDKFSIVIYEQLFYELEKIGWLHPFKLVCYYNK